ncbi:MAG: DUF447 family protein [Candidatus Altiarchaeota archaeon]|nr:DUF447 family protein [Candidatus Altiarchaeota archaeon]
MKRKKIPEGLGLKKNWIYESIVTTYSGGRANSAPMGVYTIDFEGVNLEVYKTSKTCRNILENKEFVINFTDDISLFHSSVFEKEIGYVRARKVDAPILKNADAFLEMRVGEVKDLGDKVGINAEVVDYYLNEERGGEKINPVNRADALALECLIKATKIPHASVDERNHLKKEIRYISRVVGKVAPGSEAELLVERIRSLTR